MTEGLPRDLFTGDVGRIERGLDDWVAGFERRAARFQELQHRVEDVRLSATSPSGVVTVTVDANGALIDVRFSDRVNQTAPEELTRQLLGALNQAKARIADSVQEIAAASLGADAGGSVDRIVGYYRDRFPDIDGPEAGSPRPTGRTDDGDFGDESIFDRR